MWHILSFQHLNEKAKSITGVHQWPYKAVAKALEVIPRTLIQNCGANTIRTITALRVGILALIILHNHIVLCGKLLIQSLPADDDNLSLFRQNMRQKETRPGV